MKVRYTVTPIEREVPDADYAGLDPLETEQQNAPDVVIWALEEGAAHVEVEIVDD